MVEEKAKLMKKLGKKQLTVHLAAPLAQLPEALREWNLALKSDGQDVEYTFNEKDEHTGIPELLRRLGDLGIEFKDLETRKSSLEDIFVSLVSERA
jgi:ABC-2 type transport system ATP-binding protein